MRTVVLAALISLVTAVALLPAQPAEAESFSGLWVTTSQSIDTSSAESIVAGLVKPSMTDEQKVLAIFNWYRRVIFPHNYMGADRRDLLRQINSYGCTLCGSHAANLGWLMRTAGFKTRCAFISGGGHTFIEVFYDNAWHALDPETDLAVWSRGDKPHIISMEELKADPTLLDKAIEEGRAKPWLFKAGRYPFTTRKTMADYCDTNKLDKMAMQWSSCVIKDMTIRDYFVEGVKTLKYSKENDAYGGHVSDPDLMKLSLRVNEKLVRTWDNEGIGKFILGQGFQGYPAYFMAAGQADELDTEVFPWVEPYRKDNYGIPALAVDRCYRYSGNGRLVWTPKSPGELLAAPGVKAEGVLCDQAAGTAKSANPDKPGVLTVPFRSSYALIDCRVRAVWSDGEGRLTVVAGKETKEVQPATQPAEADAGAAPGQATYFFGKAINGRFDYQLQIELPAKGTLKSIAFDHTFVNNPRALPYLGTGANKVTVRLANPDLLKRARLVVTYEWAEGPDWKTDKSDSREVTASPFEYELTVAGPKYPRMKAVTLEALPR